MNTNMNTKETALALKKKIKLALGTIFIWDEEPPEGFKGEKVEIILLMIAAHESKMALYNRQMGDGPAVGIFQQEPISLITVRDYIKRKPLFEKNLLECGIEPDLFGSPSAVMFDFELQILAARIHLWMIPEPIPEELEEMAEYCKKHWNKGGKAEAEDYLKAYLDLKL